MSTRICPSSSPSTTRKPASPRCSPGSIRRSTRWARATRVVFVNDGSRDRSAAILREQFEARPEVTRVILFGANAGQHMAIMAGFEHCRGEIVVTLDADLQNPPEEIGKLVAKMREGHDYVGSIRRKRQDSLFRTWASKAMNRLRERSPASRSPTRATCCAPIRAAW
jgi:glycosyltransferase involved in cell wall biosynthesis